MTNFEKFKRDTCPGEPTDCIKCPDFISESCIGKEQRDAPRGWIRLKAQGSVIYINVSKIIALKTWMRPDGWGASMVEKGTIVYAVDVDDTWMVDELIDEVIAKIEKA